MGIFYPMNIEILEFALVLLIGASGTGKSSFAAKHSSRPKSFHPTAHAGGLQTTRRTNRPRQTRSISFTPSSRRRLKNRRFTVVDATNVQPQSRKGLIALAKKWHALAVAIVFDLPEGIAVQRNALRSDRQFGAGPVRRQMQDLKRSLRGMQREGIRYVHGAQVER